MDIAPACTSSAAAGVVKLAVIASLASTWTRNRIVSLASRPQTALRAPRKERSMPTGDAAGRRPMRTMEWIVAAA